MHVFRKHKLVRKKLGAKISKSKATGTVAPLRLRKLRRLASIARREYLRLSCSQVPCDLLAQAKAQWNATSQQVLY